MQIVFSAPIITTVHHARNILESRGIDCVVKGEYLAGAIGEIPPQEAWVELCVLDEARFDEARQIIDEMMIASTAPSVPTQCPKCKAEIDGPFSQCWQCGVDLPEVQ